MYIWDALYGRIEFDPIVYRCMCSPEVQRLREVRLCNINSLFLTGSANTNRFEHSIGTAYLARLNMDSPEQKHLKLSKKQKETFVISALIHDIANGPFGHSYEYIMEKQGFIPEKGIKDVISDGGLGSYKQSVTLPVENIYFGKPKTLYGALEKGKIDINDVSRIIGGGHLLSPLISASIDLDNIDNVFRMAYHMGIRFTLNAPTILAKSMFIIDNKVVFKKEAEPFLNEWYDVRKSVYKFLLLNPQEFAGKYMLTEAMDIVFECISENKTKNKDIKWYYTDYELMHSLYEQKEVWLKRKMLLLRGLDTARIEKIICNTSDDSKKNEMRNYLESLEFIVPIKEKGRSGDSNQLKLNEDYQFNLDAENNVTITDRNMEFIIIGDSIYKIVNSQYNPSKIVSRLMTGDLYDCLMLIKTQDISKYEDLLDYSKRIMIETAIETNIKSVSQFTHLKIGIHPILDVNKTERQLNVLFEGNKEPITIGKKASKCLLLGVFLKNEPYGLAHAKTPLSKQRSKLKEVIGSYFASYFGSDIDEVKLYEETN